MNDLHPHWHATGDEEPPAPVAVKTSEATARGTRVAVTPASRLPAALTGVVLCTLVGFTIAGGWDALSAQVGNSSSSVAAPSTASAPLPAFVIRIAAAGGFDPASATVRPGQTITWINDQGIPHILTSQTLRDGSGAFLNTPAIFPGGRQSFTVGPREPDRPHTVTSTTDQSLVGTIVVSGSAQASASTSSRKSPLGTTDGVNLPSGVAASSRSSAKRSSSISSRKSSSSRTVAPAGSVRDAQVQPTPTYSGPPPTIDTFGDASFTPPSVPAPAGAAVAQNSYPPVTPEPPGQPDTGPGVWIVSLMSVAAFWGITRKHFVQLGKFEQFLSSK